MSKRLNSVHLGQLIIKSQLMAKHDWVAAIEDDADFSCVVNEGDSASAIFRSNASDSHEFINVNDSGINVSQPSEQLIDKLRHMVTDRVNK